MIQSLLLSLATRSQLQELREKLRPPAVDKGPVLKAKPPATQKDILGVCCDPLVLAQQLTHIELVSAAECSAWSRVGPGPHPLLLGQVCWTPVSLSTYCCQDPCQPDWAVTGKLAAGPGLCASGWCVPGIWSEGAWQPCVNGRGWDCIVLAPGWKIGLGGEGPVPQAGLHCFQGLGHTPL